MKPIVENKQRSDVNVDFPDANTGHSLCQSSWSISSKQKSPSGQENCSEEYSCCVFVICDGSSGLEAPPPHTPKKFRRRKHATMTPFQQNLKSTTEQTGATLFHRPPTARPAPEDSSPCKTSEFEPSSFCGKLSLKRALKLPLNSRKNRNKWGDFEIPERSGVLPAPGGQSLHVAQRQLEVWT